MKALRQRLEFRRARRAGRRDGKRGIPLPEEDKSAPFDLLEIKRRGDEALWRTVQEWELEDRDFRSRIVVLGADIEEATERKRVAAQQAERAQKEADKQAAENKAERASRLTRLRVAPAAVTAEVSSPTPAATAGSTGAVAPPAEANGSAPSDPQRVETADGSPDAPSVPASEDHSAEASKSLLNEPILTGKRRDESRFGIGAAPYWTAILLIIAGEVPLNAFAFRLFGEIDLFTYMMTLSLALVLVFCAHGLGIFMARTERTAVEQVLIGMLVALPIAVVTVVGIIRQQSLETRAEHATPLDALGPLAGTAAFALINLLIYAGAAVLSYLRHDPGTEQNRRERIREQEKERKDRERRERKRLEESERHRMEREKKQAQEEERRRAHHVKREQHELRSRQEMQRLKDDAERARLQGLRADELQAIQAEEARFAKREQARLALVRSAQDQLSAASRSVSTIEGELKAKRTARGHVWSAMKAQAMSVKTYYERLMMVYCAGNVAARKDRRTPPILRKLPELEMPAAFAGSKPEDN